MARAKQRLRAARAAEAVPPDERLRLRRAFPIVGVGASAGGLEAFRRLLGALPTSSGMAFVLVQHLDPNHPSILTELLSEATPMQVTEVSGDVRVAPNQVYVLPPSHGLILVDGLLKLVPRGPPGLTHLVIDSFLKTLADVQGSQAIGVILSGMGTDGTAGLQAIEAAGGIAFAQEPSSAQCPDMPKSAIAAGGVDFVLTPEDIARELERLGQHPYLAPDAVGELGGGAGAEGERGELESLTRVLELLHGVGGTDFGAYKKTTLRRRIGRRMAVSRIDSLREYARFLEGNPIEAAALYQDCLISVTSFFRDPEVFDLLGEQILAQMLKDRPADAPLRLWVPGCATGEEAYSLAICVLERMTQASSSLSLQIFATDLSEATLAKAREGAYPLSIARDVSPQRLRRFFTKVGDSYRISKSVREMCVFARHDLTRDPPYSRLDLISCRNLLIYLEPRLQEVVFATLHYALNPDGYLVLGAAESVGSSSALFTVVDEKRRIYCRKAVSGPPRLLSVRATAQPSRIGALQLQRRRGTSEAPQEADRMLLARFGPAAVVVDEGLNVLEFRGDTSPFLDHGRGKASLSLERLVRKGLMLELRRAIAEVRRTGVPVRKGGLFVRNLQDLQKVSIEVLPVAGRAAAERCQLVIFALEGAQISVASRPDSEPTPTDSRDLEIERLGQGLAQTTEYVHTLVREHESALEELQSTAEEALSSNEELQSLNEELQTAKEEIQSANEELVTLNQELHDRNVELGRSNREIQRGLDSANQLVDTVPGPLVILDGELRVEKANAAFYEIFATKPERAVGRLLAELGAPGWDRPELLSALRDVLLSGATLAERPLEVEMPGIGARTLSLNARRLHPERDAQGRLLLALEDRTEAKRIERAREQLLVLEREARAKAEAADQLKDQFVATASHELRGPLTVISAWISVLLEAGADVDPATLAKALSAMDRAVSAQGRLVKDLLEHAQIVAGKLELQREAIDLLAVAEAALLGVKAAADAKDLDLQLQHDGSRCVVLGDSDRMQQVLWNLLSNAVKFTPPRGFVGIMVGRSGNQATVRVSDTGCGITAAFLPHVFERFRQGEEPNARSRPGLGLGLTLVRELVELHGGVVRVESPGPDRGTVFTVELPIPAVLRTPAMPASPPSSEARPIASRAPEEAPVGPRLPGTRVLVVDDELDAREALGALLEYHGALVRSVASAADALTELGLALPDVLITDIGMPDVDGHELLRRVRALPEEAGRQLPVLALSAYSAEARPGLRERGGFQAQLQKPVVADELLAEVARLAGRASPAPAQ